jgi:hypothetical protein
MIDVPNPTSARSYVSSWLGDNHERLGLRQIKSEITEVPAKTLIVWYETTDYLIDICVWDHAYCLDILVYDQSSAALVFSEAGPCESTSGLMTRLNSFSNWASSHAAGA